MSFPLAQVNSKFPSFARCAGVKRAESWLEDGGTRRKEGMKEGREGGNTPQLLIGLLYVGSMVGWFAFYSYGFG